MLKSGFLASLILLVVIISREAVDAICDEQTISQNAEAKCVPLLSKKMGFTVHNLTTSIKAMVEKDPTSILQPKVLGKIQKLFAYTPELNLRAFFCMANEWKSGCPNAHPEGFYDMLNSAFCSQPAGADTSPSSMFPFYVNWKCGKGFTTAEAQSVWDGMQCHQKVADRVAGYAGQCILSKFVGDTDATGGNKLLLALVKLGQDGTPESFSNMQNLLKEAIDESLCADPAVAMDCIGLRPIQDACSKEKACRFRSAMRNNLQCSRPDVVCTNLNFKSVALPGTAKPTAKPQVTVKPSTPDSGATRVLINVPFMFAFGAAAHLVW